MFRIQLRKMCFTYRQTSFSYILYSSYKKSTYKMWTLSVSCFLKKLLVFVMVFRMRATYIEKSKIYLYFENLCLNYFCKNILVVCEIILSFLCIILIVHLNLYKACFFSKWCILFLSFYEILEIALHFKISLLRNFMIIYIPV